MITFDLSGSVAPVRTSQTLLGRLLQQLLTQRLGLFGEFGRIRLLRLAHPPVHFFALDLLLARPERGLALDHLVDQTAQTEKVGAERVTLVVDHLGSCKKSR